MNNNTTPKPHLSIGVLGAARIAKKNCRAASHPAAFCKVVAVASRSKEKVDDFVSEVFSTISSTAPVTYGGDSAYFDLIADKTCDAVYIPLPSKLHFKYVIRALEAGKHVLLEKPVANSAEEYRQMLKAASENRKLLMDGTMFVHHPRTKQFVKAVPNPTRVHFNFTFDGDEQYYQNDIRTKKDGDFMGCVGDLGWYCIRMGLLVFSEADAEKLNDIVTHVQVTRYQLNDEDVPLDAECMVYFTKVSMCS
jgi:predicted dehydrogenase